MRTGVDETACRAARAAVLASRRGHHQMLLAVADLEARRVPQASGYRCTRRLLEDLWRLDPAHARRLVTQAALLTPSTTTSGSPVAPVLPATAAACEQGLIDDAHLRVIARAMDRIARIPGVQPDTVADAEELLAEHATQLSPAGLEKVATRLIATLDPDGAAPDENPDPLDELHLLRRRDGRLQGSFEIHGRADAELIVEVFDRLSAPAGPDDTRTLAQRRAEVLADLAAQAASPTGIASHHDDTDTNTDTDTENADENADLALDGADGEHDDSADTDTNADGDGDGDGAPASAREDTDPPAPQRSGRRAPGCPVVPVLGRALLAVTIDHQWLTTTLGHGLLDSDLPVDPAVARRLACDAGIVPMILGSRSEPLDVGRLSYTVPDGIRRALHHRDGGCTFPGCTRRPKRCHAHHVQHWLDGGDTCLENLTLLCRYHHHLVHHDHWTVEMIDGRPWYTPPRWIDPTQRPRPGGRHPLTEPA